MIDDLPGYEILFDSISTEVKRLSFDDKFSEFDLEKYNLVFKLGEIFISLEVLNCSHPAGTECSFCFIGTEHGNYLYSDPKKTDWQESGDDYTIYLRLFYKY